MKEPPPFTSDGKLDFLGKLLEMDAAKAFIYEWAGTPGGMAHTIFGTRAIGLDPFFKHMTSTLMEAEDINKYLFLVKHLGWETTRVKALFQIWFYLAGAESEARLKLTRLYNHLSKCIDNQTNSHKYADYENMLRYRRVNRVSVLMKRFGEAAIGSADRWTNILTIMKNLTLDLETETTGPR